MAFRLQVAVGLAVCCLASAKGGPRPLIAPADLVRSASELDIPSLGGKHFQRLNIPNADNYRLTRDITGFRLKAGKNNYHRQIVKLTGRQSKLYLTKKSNMTFNGRTYFYDPMDLETKGPQAVVYMNKVSAVQRLPPFNMMFDKSEAITYEVNHFHPTCQHQHSVGIEPMNGKKLYSFARIHRPANGNWRVVRIDCDKDDQPRGTEAYQIQPKEKNFWRVISPTKGLVAVLRRNENSELDYADGWMTRHEDPLLFSVAMMVMNEPQSPGTIG